MTSANDLKSDTNRPYVIGGVGPRVLPQDQASLRCALRKALGTLLDEHGGKPERLLLLISVAEGADRLLIEAARSLGIPYTSVLPCSAECFAEDFETNESVEEFQEILANAKDIVQPPEEPDRRIDGYLWASHYILDRADLLLAVWDGHTANGPAGTAYSIEKAANALTPVMWIPTAPPHEPVHLLPPAQSSVL